MFAKIDGILKLQFSHGWANFTTVVTSSPTTVTIFILSRFRLFVRVTYSDGVTLILRTFPIESFSRRICTFTCRLHGHGLFVRTNPYGTHRVYEIFSTAFRFRLEFLLGADVPVTRPSAPFCNRFHREYELIHYAYFRVATQDRRGVKVRVKAVLYGKLPGFQSIYICVARR